LEKGGRQTEVYNKKIKYSILVLIFPIYCRKFGRKYMRQMGQSNLTASALIDDVLTRVPIINKYKKRKRGKEVFKKYGDF
jgi:hypothetical protein